MQKLPKQRVVLLGMGHTNIHIAGMWRMNPVPRTELVCISDSLVAAYSGMAPGVLAGNYEPEKMNIDLVRFCKSVGAWLINERVTQIDFDTRSIEFDDRPPLLFDILSIGIGSRPDKPLIPENFPQILPIKPMQTLLPRLEEAIHQLKTGNTKKPRVFVVGGGVGGIEIAFGIPEFLRKKGFATSEISIISSDSSLSPALAKGTTSRIETVLKRKNISVVTGRHVTCINERTLELSDQTSIEYDLVLLATSAIAPELFDSLSISRDEKGFILTRPTLQSLDYDSVFVVGDSGTLKDNPTPKAGVFAVRQGPVLWENINRYLDHRSLIDYKPQKDFLKLLNTGDQKAIAEYKGFSFWNRWAWWLKDRIDTRFIEQYQDYQPRVMATPDPAGQVEMRCLGCGGKIGGSLLSRVLQRLDVKQSDDIVVGLANPDDCAVVRTAKQSVAVTTDFFAAPVDDPFLVGRIAALNALSDVFVMGADPQAALAIITLPYGREKNQEELLFQVLSGSLREFDGCGTSLVGGHTIEGPQLVVGYTILAEPSSGEANFTKAELKIGDRLVLSKPIGSGAVLAAFANADCSHRTFRSLVQIMTKSNRTAAGIAREFDVQAMTDVTGFGLAGHLLEMFKASGLVADVEMGKIPLIEGSHELFEQGIESTLAPANRDAEIAISVKDSHRQAAQYKALFDPQTCGGVLMGVPASLVDEVLIRLRSEGHHDATEIGTVRAKPETDHLIYIE